MDDINILYFLSLQMYFKFCPVKMEESACCQILSLSSKQSMLEPSGVGLSFCSDMKLLHTDCVYMVEFDFEL